MTKYAEGINVENCNKLLDWLEAGAPHAVFEMNFSNIKLFEAFGTRDIEDILEEAGYEYPMVVDQVKSKGIGDCGTVCCIAGAAAGLANGDISNPKSSDWDEIPYIAAEYLGIKRQDDAANRYMFHDLFDPGMAPKDCTPAQAAQALRNVMVGEEPWEEVSA